MVKKYLFLVILPFVTLSHAQESTQKCITAIYQNALRSYEGYEHLRTLCSQAKGRLVGSKASEVAIQLLKSRVERLTPDTVYLQQYTTPSWRCITPAQARMYTSKKSESLNVINLGLSVSTPKEGINAEVIEVKSLKALDSLGFAAVKGKIVFFNRPMDNGCLNTFEAYSGGVDQRGGGAAKAAQYGAVGTLVRSLSTEPNDLPHTGVSRYRNGVPQIPNLSISTNDANKLSQQLARNSTTRVWIKSETETLDSVHTANIIAEIKGSQFPEKVIVIGAHIDAWFNSPGAHDDGAGCEQMIDVLRIFKELHIRPRYTIRLVLFMDEEMYQSGAKAYAESVRKEKREHIASIESDAGGLLPTGFGIDASDSTIEAIQKLSAPLSGFGIFKREKGHGGTDIAPLKEFGIPLIGLETNSQRYFEYHHTSFDVFENVSRREMQMGSAAIASLVYLIDQNGIQ